MLQRLELKTFGPIEHVCLELEPGFVAITGETGAGKSVLLGGLRFLTADRAGAAPPGPAWAQAVLSPTPAIQEFLNEQGLPSCEDESLFITRSLPAKGPGKAYINGQAVPLGLLQALGQLWIDFHDAQAPKKSLDPKEQLRLLDAFGEIDSRFYQKAYCFWETQRAEHQKLLSEEDLDETQLKKMQQALNRMQRLDLSDEGIHALEAQARSLDDAQQQQEHAQALYYALETQVLEACRKSSQHSRALQALDPQGSAGLLAKRLETLQVELQDIAQEAFGESQKAAQALLYAESTQAQMELWLGLKHAHGGSPAAVRAKQALFKEKLERQKTLEGRLLELEHALRSSEAAAWEAAAALREKRQSAAKALQARLGEKLQALGLEHATLEVTLKSLSTLGPDGADSILLLFTPNRGHSPQPLQAIASSGEGARVHLALTSILAKNQKTPVLVFDEIDANVGGEVARCVGQQLALLSKDHQVFCITHLPQVASQATQHYCVVKTHSEQHTHIHLDALHPYPLARRTELARMLGDRHAPSALQHAEALIRR